MAATFEKVSCYNRPVASMDVPAIARGRQSTSTPLFLLLAPVVLMAPGLGCGSGGGQAPGTGGNSGRGGSGGTAAAGAAAPARRRRPDHRADLRAAGGDRSTGREAEPDRLRGSRDPTKLAASVIPYEVNSPLWSDGADKRRGLALPDRREDSREELRGDAGECRGRAPTTASGCFPVGTVMVKSFLFDGKLVETRLFVHFDAATWVGYSYQWDEAQTDATHRRRRRASRSCSTPASARSTGTTRAACDCMTCHTPTGGSTLGPETAQINRVVDGTNQIDTLEGAGAVRDAAGDAVQGGARRADRNRRDGRGARALLPARELRLLPPPRRRELPEHRSAARRRVQGHAHLRRHAEKGNQGVSTSLIITPGMPAKSVVVLRMTAPPDDDEGKHGRMPKIASYVVDDAAVTLISNWITGITTCP